MTRKFELALTNKEVDQLEAKAKRLNVSQAQVVEQLVRQALRIDAQNVAAHGAEASPK